MLLLVGPPERSIARNNIPSKPAGFIPPPDRSPPILMFWVTWSKVGVWPPTCALLERTQEKVFPSPPIKRLPFVSTSSVPSVGPLGITIGACQVIPPSVDRWNWTPLPLQLIPSLDWYWKPCPGPPVLSMVNHCLSPPPASPSGWSRIQVWPKSSEPYMLRQKVCKR